VPTNTDSHYCKHCGPLGDLDLDKAVQTETDLLPVECLLEVNDTRAKKRLPPFVQDPCLTAAAELVAQQRAAALCAGHTSNDFRGLPDGCNASASGCAAWAPEDGWGSCCTYERHTYAGAAYCVGSDGRRYMQLFVRD
jgi:hypothetical protein